ncbi:hypothetical protein CBR_g48350 [Chara braunii]|uniref:Uncharacterized protein n=1 Tax=Chara braunii TaxID=69332 RepID=A0A388K497_CHABU|nr:hypothetical protein CBR_g48350 [Chara braunii]|eukprot:GBG64882.1 hypothetical protein CBR_g48350 [Chara braunii]
MGGNAQGGGAMHAMVGARGAAASQYGLGGQGDGSQDSRGGNQGTSRSSVREATSENRGTGGMPGKHRRLRHEDSATSDLHGIRREKSSSTESEGSQGRIREIITRGMKTTRRRIPVAVARGQQDGIEPKILPLFCTLIRNETFFITWTAQDGSMHLLSLQSPESPMPTAMANMVSKGGGRHIGVSTDS